MKYAKDTSVSSGKSREEIERTLARFGAEGFMYGYHGAKHVVEFAAHGKRIRFLMQLPSKTDRKFLFRKRYGRDAANPPEVVEKLWEAETRQHWRALALLVKAKLAAVEAGITTFEEEFLAHIVITDGSGRTTTVGEYTLPRVEQAYLTGKLPPLLPGKSGDSP